MRTEQAEIAVHGGEQAVDAHVSLRQHRMKHAAHPCGRCQRGLIRRQVTAGAQQVSVRTQYPQLLGAQHHVAVGTVEERQARHRVRSNSSCRHCDPNSASQRVGIQIAAFSSGAELNSVVASARCRGGADLPIGGALPAAPVRSPTRSRSAARCGIRMIRQHTSRRTPPPRWLRLQPHRCVADHHHGVFMLQAPAREHRRRVRSAWRRRGLPARGTAGRRWRMTPPGAVNRSGTMDDAGRRRDSGAMQS